MSKNKIKDLILYNTYPDFPKEGVMFIDLNPSLHNSKIRNKIIDCLVDLYYDEIKDNKNKTLDYIIAPEARGFIWGSMVAQEMKLGFIPVRKPGKLPQDAVLKTVQFETEYSTTSLELPKVDLNGKRLLFVDDVYATGGTYEAIENLVREVNGTLVGGVVLVDIDLAVNAKVKSLIKAKDLLN